MIDLRTHTVSELELLDSEAQIIYQQHVRTVLVLVIVFASLGWLIFTH